MAEAAKVRQGSPKRKAQKKVEKSEKGKVKDFSGTGIHRAIGGQYQKFLDENPLEEKGLTDCKCNVGWEAGIVLDPFFGSGTTGMVARQLDRNWIGIELNKEYIKLAWDRFKQEKLF